MMKFKKAISASLAVLMAVSMAACATQENPDSKTGAGLKDENADKGLEVMGNAVQYDPNHLVNKGDPIQIDWWIWDGEDLFKKYIEQYEEMHPNVDIKVVVNPFNDYWTKLPLALKGKDGPAIFNIHNSYHENIIKYCEPYDIPNEDIFADFTGAEAHEIDGKIYYIDYGMMTAAFYYNKELWNKAGLSEQDIPKTWDELAEVAQKLTIKDEDGNIIQAGLNLNGGIHGMLLGLHYQHGENLMKEDGETPNINSDAMKETAKMLIDFYDKYHVGSKDFGTDGGQSFGQGQSAMVYNWGFYNGMMKNDYPDIDYGTFQIPTLDGNVPYAYDRYNGESTLGINKNNSAEVMEVAQDFNRFYLANKEMQKEMCLLYSVFPANKALDDDKDILANPALSVVAGSLDRYIWPGPMPATFENTLKKSVEDILYNGVTIDDAFDAAQETIQNDLKQTAFESVESQYKYVSEKK